MPIRRPECQRHTGGNAIEIECKALDQYEAQINKPDGDPAGTSGIDVHKAWSAEVLG
jgi:hypothetical protein